MSYRVIILTAALIGGCGRTGFEGTAALLPQGDNDGDSVTDIDVPVTPTITLTGPATALPLTRVRFNADVQGASSNAVTWNISGTSTQAIDAQGIFTVPATVGSYVITATSVADTTVSASSTLTVTTTVTSATITSTPSVDNSSGLAHQNHIVRAAELGEWWIWYTSGNSTTRLLSRWSNDFVTWHDGSSVALNHTHGNDGRNLAIADRIINGKHVVHFSTDTIDTERAHVHIRATLDGNGTCTFGDAVRTNTGGTLDPDGPAAVITESGEVIDGSGWDATPATPNLSPCGDGDHEVYTFGSNDDGTTFESTNFTKKVIWCTTLRSNARWFGSSGDIIYTLYENGTNDPNPSNLFYNVRTPQDLWLPDETTTRTVPPTVFATDVSFQLNDWSVRMAGAWLHAVRRSGASTIEHRMIAVGDTAAAWGPGASIPSITGNASTGLFLATYGEGLLLVQITSTSSSDANTLSYTFFNGTFWSAWTQLDAPSITRAFIAGSTPTGGERPALIWTETLSSAPAIRGALLP